MMGATSNGSGTLLMVTIRNTGCGVGLTSLAWVLIPFEIFFF
jgi:hypothetical protein